MSFLKDKCAHDITTTVKTFSSSSNLAAVHSSHAPAPAPILKPQQTSFAFRELAFEQMSTAIGQI